MFDIVSADASREFVSAAVNSDLSVVELYLAAGINPNVIGFIEVDAAYGLSALYAAAFRNNVPLIGRLLGAGADPNMPLDGGWAGAGVPPLYWRYPLHLAARCASVEAFDFLLDNGANPRMRSSYDGTAAHCLIDAWSHPGYQGKTGSRALQQRLALLFQMGVPIDQRDKDGMTILALAITCRAEIDTIAFLLDQGASTHRIGARGASALHLAAASGNVECTRLLIGRGIHADTVDDQGRTALCQIANPQCGQILLSSGASIDHADFDGRTALDYKIRNPDRGPGAQDNFQLLLSAGANPHSPDYYGQTPRQVAKNLGQDTLSAMLAAHESRQSMSSVAVQ